MYSVSAQGVVGRIINVRSSSSSFSMYDMLFVVVGLTVILWHLRR